MSVDAVLIAGPTASGKSAAALALAEEIGAAVINTDSMQVYTETRILTARPTDHDTARAPHLLYGHVSVSETYSAGRYQAEAAHALRTVRESGRIPVFAGGTGMYFGVLTNGFTVVPPVPSSVRQAAEVRRNQMGAEAFHTELATRDPLAGKRLRPGDSQRVLRAWEVFEATGRPLSEWQTEMSEPALANMKLARFVISPPRDVLHARITRRFDAMLAAGAMEEASALGNPSPTAAKIIGLRELRAAAEGSLSRHEAVEQAKARTRQYAKRQMTWFRHRMADWHWVDASETRDILPILKEGSM